MARTRITLLLFAILSAVSLHAQTFEQIAFVRLNDPAPRSVRSAAMGGATDAASAGAGDLALNPALSASLNKPTFLAAASRNSLAVQNGASPASSHRWRESTTLSHAAAAFPLGRAVIGAYYAAEPRIEGPEGLVTSFGTDPYVAPHCPRGCSYVFQGFNSAFSRREQRYGVTAAFQAGSLSFGAGAEIQDLDEEAQVIRHALPIEPIPTSHPERVFRGTEGREVVPNAGIRWAVTPRFALAAAYNGAATFTRRTNVCGTAPLTAGLCATQAIEEGSSPQKMADAIRFGASFRPLDRLVLVAEAVRRNHSNLADERSSMIGTPVLLEYQDVTELHAGAEYQLGSVALRAGWWRDPGRLRTFPDVLAISADHFTVGAGVDIGPAQLEVSYDDSSDPIARRAMIGVRF